MIKNYFKIALRKIIRHKIYSCINIISLAIGMTCTLLLILMIRYELSFDRYHENSKNIYRIVKGEKNNSVPKRAAVTVLLAEELQKEFPEVLETVRITKLNQLVHYKDKHIIEKQIIAETHLDALGELS